MRLTNNKCLSLSTRLVLSGLLLGCAFIISSSDVIDEPSSLPALPDFTRTYGFDIRPDISLLSTKKSSKKKTGLKAIGNKLKQRLQKKSGENLQYGVQKFTQYSGNRRYGIGIQRKKETGQQDNLTVHGHGISYDRQKKNYKYYMGIDSRSPVESKEEKDSSYMYFGIKANW